MSHVIDDDDYAVYVEAFHLAEAVRRFLARNRTQAVVKARVLDADVTGDLVEANERMTAIRKRRLDNVGGDGS